MRFLSYFQEADSVFTAEMFRLLVMAFCAGLASASCLSGWFEHYPYCYWRSSYSTTWHNARDACPTYGSGSHLASIHSLTENSAVIEHFNFGDSWIGLNDDVTEGQFFWVDGSAVDYTNWAHHQPNNYFNQDCVSMPHSDDPSAGQWDDVECDTDRHFICKMPA